MNTAFIITFLLLGFIGSFSSGLLGIGGAIINYPIHLYIPPLLGLDGVTAHEISGIVAVQVFFSTLGGVWAYRRGGYINKPLFVVMGSSIMVGSFAGGYISQYVSETIVNVMYGVLALTAAIIIFIPKKETNGETVTGFNKPLAAVLALVVGLASGVVGAGGSFILLPIMLIILKIPMRITIATSMAITFVSSIGGVIGKVTTGQVPYLPAVLIIIVSLIAAPLGVKISRQINHKVLQWSLALLILITSIKLWSDILF
ncbi:sulfite exporter TauE/SafE family protein [Peribacillus glennii]|uniref:Probable membrane transporter protein n=1 Tax=Peribacillus glennii TaxID=2303991 RepID=A0A372LEE0_9BACI|nr:sulfite exporter TauE/SafE family protein [Peribacillus glennii]RFU64675.1 sulfite exporter TauE/SafE family protein [Peribacillus glennii]